MNEHGNPPPDVGGYRVDGPDARPMLEVEAVKEPLPKIREVLECASPLALFPGAVAPDMEPRF